MRISASVSAIGRAPAIVTVCEGEAVIALDAGDDIIVTCGSVIIEVLSGQVEVTFIAEDGTEAMASLGKGNELTFDAENFTFDAPASNPGTISIEAEGHQMTVASGEQLDAMAVVESATPVSAPAPAVEEPTPAAVARAPSLDEGSSNRGLVAAGLIVIILALGIVGGAFCGYRQKLRG